MAGVHSEQLMGRGAGGSPVRLVSGEMSLPVTKVPISSLLPADSPRLAGEDLKHISMLASVEASLPPILVHRPTMRVIDGMHRVRAALVRGEKTIDVQLFDGAEDAAFMLAVKANITHGLPLTLADREAAAARIIALRPELSDRAIAECTGLAGKTVGAIRKRASGEITHSHARVGRDGRVRPLTSAVGRRLAYEVMLAHPDASLREVAKIADVSPGTVRDVRKRMLVGDDPVPEQQRKRERGAAADGDRGDQPGATHVSVGDPSALLRVLQADPSLRLTDSGRALLWWLNRHVIRREDWAKLDRTIPPHCVKVVADLARGYAGMWLEFADTVESADSA